MLKQDKPPAILAPAKEETKEEKVDRQFKELQEALRK